MASYRQLVLAVAGVVAACCSFLPLAASAQPTQVVQPLPLPGPYAVACSNVTQDFTRMAPGEDVQNYWEGVPRSDGSSRYITDLLSDAGNTLAVTVNAPDDGNVFGSFAGQSIPFVVVVCYPTAAGNPRPDYPLPNGNAVPHMQRGAEAPLLADPAARFPLLVFSHGLLGSPLSNDYLLAMSVFASNGYVVAAPFHGDGRFSLLQPESLSDFAYLVTHLRDFNAMQALRPLTLSATLDLLLAHPQWRDHLDAARIGGFGASLGGESLLLMAGAGLTTSVGMSWSNISNDTRLKAAVGYVPYFGQVFFPAFGRGQHGLDNVTLPFLAISGTADTTAPLAATAQGIDQLAGPRELVALTGVTHGFDVASTNDIFTWALTFLDANVRGDSAASSRLAQMGSVAGGGDDRVLFSSLTAPPSVTTNYGGLWWNAPAGSEDGWGISLAHQGDIIFASWFTYDVARNPLWMVMTAYKTAEGVYSGTLYTTSGPAFNAVPFDPNAVVRTPVGTGTLTFVDANNGTFTYAVNGLLQSKTITRAGFRASASVHVRRATESCARDELPGHVVESVGVGVGHQPDAGRLDDLRCVVHLQSGWHAPVVDGDGHADAASRRLCGFAVPDSGPGLLCGSVRSGDRHQVNRRRRNAELCRRQSCNLRLHGFRHYSGKADHAPGFRDPRDRVSVAPLNYRASPWD